MPYLFPDIRNVRKLRMT